MKKKNGNCHLGLFRAIRFREWKMEIKPIMRGNREVGIGLCWPLCELTGPSLRLRCQPLERCHADVRFKVLQWLQQVRGGADAAS